MNCVFCKQECVKTLDAQKAGNGWPDKWECDSHPYKIEYWQYIDKGGWGNREDNLRYDFKVKYKDKVYRFYFQMDKASMYGNKDIFRIEHIFDVNSNRMFSNGRLLELKFIPQHIKPENALQKLPILLLFS